MHNQENKEIPHYPVRIWEILLVLLGAIGLTATGLVGLGLKVLNNAFDPPRAEAIASSFISYNIPGGAQGVFGITIGGAKLARIRSATNPPDVILLVGETPIQKETTDTDDQPQLNENLKATPSDNADQEFIATASRTEDRQFCNQVVPVTIEAGEQFATDGQSPAVPATRYTAKATDDLRERVVILTASGDNAQQRAETVFNSLRCK